MGFLKRLWNDKDSIKSKQQALATLAKDSMREADRIQNSVTNLQTTNNQIDTTVKEIEEMKSRKSQNEVYINMFRPQQ